MAISNQIFDYYQQHKKEIDKAVTLLKNNGYIVYEKNAKKYDKANR